MVELIKKMLKSVRIGRAIYPKLNRLYRKYYSLPKRRRAMAKYGYELVDKIEAFSARNHFGCFAVFGTLLGFIREGGFIGHDSDLDIGVLYWKSPAEFTRLLAKEPGFTFLHGFSYHGETIEVTFQYKGVPVDFFFYKTDGERSWCTTCNWDPKANYNDVRENSVKHVYQARVTELKNIVVHGVKTSVPCNSEEMLASVFGPTWRIPDPSFKPTQQPGNVYLDDFGYIESYETIVSRG